MVLFDNNVLCLLLHPDADVPNDPATGKPIERAADRVGFLLERLEEAGARILIPAPVLSEFLTFADPEYLLRMTQSIRFEVAPFDSRAAVEAAVALKRALRSGTGKRLGLASPWQKIKVDRQIVAVGRVYKVDHVYTTDTDVLALAKESGLAGTHVAQLPLPPDQVVQLTLEDLVETQDSQALAPAPPTGLIAPPTSKPEE